MRQAHGCSLKQVAAILQDRSAISTALPPDGAARRADGGSQTKGMRLFNWGLCPQTPTGIKELYALKNNRQNQNL
jgi:hypothetical protein